MNLHQATLDYAVITSPENISRLSKKYLETDLFPYKRSQIKQLDKKAKILTRLETTKNNKAFKKRNEEIKSEKKVRVAKKIELKKLQELYSKPEEIPAEIKIQVAKKIKEKKTAIKNLYSSPGETITLKKAQKWAAVQVVKVFLGMPIIPGK